MTAITTGIVDAIKVQFLRPIFEDDFPEKGMKAWLVDVEWSSRDECYKLYFDFTEFEAENDKYFKQCYYSNCHTSEIARETGRTLFTAKEAGMYNPKYQVFFGLGNMTFRDDVAFAEEIQKYLRVVD